jgi:hypothetical protein
MSSTGSAALLDLMVRKRIRPDTVVGRYNDVPVTHARARAREEG